MRDSVGKERSHNDSVKTEEKITCGNSFLSTCLDYPAKRKSEEEKLTSFFGRKLSELKNCLWKAKLHSRITSYLLSNLKMLNS